MAREERPGSAPRGRYLLTLSLASLGVVYGDIGTSPLYAIRECFVSESHELDIERLQVFGVLSLVFWSLILVISVKYLAYVMRADNEGEGGILALTALAQEPERRGLREAVIVLIGLFGAALLYGDGIITPAISVLSAVEGIKDANPQLDALVVPITVAILFGLFWFQRRGTAGVGILFGPITLVWFLALATLGIWQISMRPEVLEAALPTHAVAFIADEPLTGLLVLGSVFLVVTGGEALYADMGHFGRLPIRLTWYVVVLPSLLLNYFGQGALLLRDPTAVESPFYRMAPEWALYPMIGLSTAATIIASQAVISGAFSLSFQAVMLGWLPRLQIRHTSRREYGQIYIPAVNWALMAATVVLVVAFQESKRLAAAYGVAVTTTMVITAVLAFVVAVRRWRWPLWAAVLVTVLFLAIDLAFFSANIVKVPDGGWVPIAIAVVIVAMMTTWKRGRDILGQRIGELTISWEAFPSLIDEIAPATVPGSAVFMAGHRGGPPPALVMNVRHNRVVHEQVIVLTIVTERRPKVPISERLEVHRIDDRFVRLVGHYGFSETPHVPALLELAVQEGVHVEPERTTYFVGRETMFATERPGMALWRERLFARMSRNAQGATSFFGIPRDRVFEVGSQIEL